MPSNCSVTGWIGSVPQDDIDRVIEGVSSALDGEHVETQVRLARIGPRPSVGERPQTHRVRGLLAQPGTALLHHDDPEGFEAVVASEPTFGDRRRAEGRRYGLNGLRLLNEVDDDL